MTEFEKADLDGNGSVDQSEWDKLLLEDKRIKIEDDELHKGTAQLLDGVVRFSRITAVSCYNYL